MIFLGILTIGFISILGIAIFYFKRLSVFSWLSLASMFILLVLLSISSPLITQGIAALATLLFPLGFIFAVLGARRDGIWMICLPIVIILIIAVFGSFIGGGLS
jgi:hypothetical protein